MSFVFAVSNKQLSSLYKKLFSDLSQFFSVEKLEGVKRCAIELQNQFPRRSHLEQNKVLVAFGGGKDSSYMLAFVRMVQLLLFEWKGNTFQIRVATNRHAGMPKAVMENIHRVYCALQLYDDPYAELLLVDENKVHPFESHRPLPNELVERNRQDILMTGHRTQANARPTFCNACNLSMVNSFGVAAWYKDNVDIIITGDSPQEQKAYAHWVNYLARKSNLNLRRRNRGFKAFLETIDALSQKYFREIYGHDAGDAVEARRVTSDTTDTIVSEPLFFSIYNYTDYSAGDHWELLTEYLKFQFDDLAFSFSESDCGNPALMAHLHGLKCDRVYGRNYVEGIEEYVKFATHLMRQKQFPDFLIDQMIKRYRTKEAVELMRKKVNTFALESFSITEEQLICMVYAPFVENARNLEMYLANERSSLLPNIQEIHKLLEERTEIETSQQLSNLADELYHISGLNLQQLRTCYRSPLLGSNMTDSSKLVNLVLERDPHKGIIETRYSQEGPIVKELISGR